LSLSVECCSFAENKITKDMILSDFSYREGTGWQLDKLSLDKLNLIVGLNSVGKSRTMVAIGNVVHFIKGEQQSIVADFSCSMTLHNHHSISYSFEVQAGVIESEKLSVDGVCKIERDTEVASMYGESINPPSNKLVIQARRDTKRYPEVEEIIQWAEQTSVFVFSNITTSPNSLSPYTISSEPLLPVMYEKLPASLQELLIDCLRKMNYQINRLEVNELPSGSKMLLIYEEGVTMPMRPFELSNGMFRVICSLLYMMYCSTLSSARCLIIDDIGEGLDYMRSTMLGKMVFRFCEENDIQLIATSNDSFLMDVVDLRYWNILLRRGGNVSSLNSKKNANLFESFARTGLNNFDLLSSNFIINHTPYE